MNKVADLVGQFLKQHVDHVFCISGGASLHLIHGCVNAGIEIICPQNENAASFQADAYARIRGMGCCIVTSGPGATNTVTGIASAWFDSVPCLFITGQQARSRLKGDLPVRQIGFQETDVIGMVKDITKWAKQPKEPEEVIPMLKEALQIAREPRSGPVLLDLCDDLQRAMI